jgi:predicted alpha-1,2-mannosidase
MGTLEVVNDREVRVTCRSGAGAEERRAHFVVRFSRPVAEQAVSIDGEPATPEVKAQGAAVKAWFRFGGPEPLLVRVGASLVDGDGAARNLEAEPMAAFDAVRKRAERAWETELSRVRIEGGTAAQRTVFHTGLYRSLLEPRLMSDADGLFRDVEGRVRPAMDGVHYDVSPTAAASHALHGLLDRERSRHFALSAMGEGAPTDDPEAAKARPAAVAEFAIPMIAGAVLQELPGLDAERALAAMMRGASADRRDRATFDRHGFIPAEEDEASVARTLAYAYGDWCIAQVAGKLGKIEERNRRLRGAQGYKHLFDPTTGFLRPRLQGHWVTPFAADEAVAAYGGRTARQATISLPHDIDGIARLQGGAKTLVRNLDLLVAAGSLDAAPGAYGALGASAFPTAALYAYAGQPWKTQKLARLVFDAAGSPENVSAAGRRASASHALGALGLQLAHPASDQWMLVAPRFSRSILALDGGRRLVIRAEGDVGAHAFVRGAKIDGRAHPRTYLSWAELRGARELVLVLGAEPGSWGGAAADRPASRIDEVEVIPAPFVAQGDRVFEKRTDVSLGCADPEARIHYTLDGSEPTGQSPSHTALPIGSSVVMKAIAMRGELRSPVVELRFTKRGTDTQRAARSQGKTTR